MSIQYSGALHLNYDVRYGIVSDTSSQNREKVSVSLQYLARFDLERLPTYVASYIEKQNWWDKLLFWLK
jgi:hypothetical protein